MSDSLQTVARQMVSEGRGILAADESISTVTTRLEKAGVAPDEEHRRAYREMLVTTPGLAVAISGVILADDTLRARLSDGRTFPEAVSAAGMIPGIKVDTGAKPLAGAPGETVTEGLDGLRERFEEYAPLGAQFAKWRAVIKIGPELPTYAALHANAHALARYAALSQEAGLVPIVEPEVLMEGDHDLDCCAAVTSTTLTQVFEELGIASVDLRGIVLKPNMVTAGTKASRQASVEEVAQRTVEVLRSVVPAEVPGVAFLSGGQPPEVATAHLGAMQLLGRQPWELTFSFGRALVDPALKAWHGDPALVEAGQAALHERSAANGAARLVTAGSAR